MQNGDSLVLGIESSCDDTGVAVVRASDGAILGQAITGQVHLPYSSQRDQKIAGCQALCLLLSTCLCVSVEAMPAASSAYLTGWGQCEDITG